MEDVNGREYQNNKMEVVLMNKECIQNSLGNTVKAIRKCYNSKSDMIDGVLGEKDERLLDTILNNKHLSTLEHTVFTFDISNISRDVLMELTRHRIASPSVKSTRYTINKMLADIDKSPESIDKFFNTDVLQDDTLKKMHNEYVSKVVKYLSQKEMNGDRIPNDVIKYAFPPTLFSNLVFTINLRSLLNLIELRTSPRALNEIRELANRFIDCFTNTGIPALDTIKRLIDMYLNQD